MKDVGEILALWRELESQGSDYVLATVAIVEGSSYRRPGARMLLSADGRRAGTVSGGCLEAAVAKKAWWLTQSGPVLERYSTLEDDGDLPYGSGCGGVVWILLERSATARPMLRALELGYSSREPLAVATVIRGEAIGQRAYAGFSAPPSEAPLQRLAAAALEAQESTHPLGHDADIWAEYIPPRPALWIFGAGDDARPLLAIAKELGWFVSIADGRAHLATAARFPAADSVRAVQVADVPGPAWGMFDIRYRDAVLLVTHSFEQDSRFMAALLQSGALDQGVYVGVLGPQRRTREVLAEAARLLHRSAEPAQIEAWLERLHAPTGLDLGPDGAASVALSIVAEVQMFLAGATGRPLRVVRATPAPVLS